MPLSNSSEAMMWVGVLTGMTSPFFGPLPTTRSGKLAAAIAQTRFTGPTIEASACT
jgi:hypothetical protein